MQSSERFSQKNYDAIVIGGGLAGLTTAICLAKAKCAVLVIEKQSYPRHKVCGEYVSNEVRCFLEYLGLDLRALGATEITNFSISNPKGKTLDCSLPLGGFGISRYALDNALYQLAKESAVSFVFETATQVDFREEEGVFIAVTKSNTYKAKIAIGAHGKRSGLDKAMNRSFIQKKSPWLGVKGHYKFKGFKKDKVALHCFPGGYGGLSMIEEGLVNFCYLAHYKNFQKEKTITSFNKNVVSKNPYLKDFLSRATLVFEHPLSIAQISFYKKELVKNHVLLCGDSAGLIHPLCGNGMAMAIHAGKIASEFAICFLKDSSYNRNQMEADYTAAWNAHFVKRLWMGRKLQSVITSPLVVNTFFSFAPNSKLFLSWVIKQTHGKAILV